MCTSERLLRLLPITFLVTSCGGGFEIAEGNLSGTVAGDSWEVRSATTDSFMSDDTTYSVTLFGGADEVTCDTVNPETTAPLVMASIPKTVGEHELKFELLGSDNLTVTVVPSPSENIVLTEGIIDVESIGDGVIRAGMYATDESGDYELSGRFEVQICGE